MDHPQNENAVYQAVLAGELEIDDRGRVWRVAKRTFDRWTNEVRTTPCKRVRAENKTASGYFQVRVMMDSKRFCAAAHRLVYIHFIGLIPDGITINHMNGKRTDNSPANLELASYTEQRRHSLDVLQPRRRRVK